MPYYDLDYIPSKNLNDINKNNVSHLDKTKYKKINVFIFFLLCLNLVVCFSFFSFPFIKNITNEFMAVDENVGKLKFVFLDDDQSLSNVNNKVLSLDLPFIAGVFDNYNNNILLSSGNNCIYAPEDGVILDISNTQLYDENFNYFYSKEVLINHYGNVVSKIVGVCFIGVSVGESVVKNQIIGFSCNSVIEYYVCVDNVQLHLNSFCK